MQFDNIINVSISTISMSFIALATGIVYYMYMNRLRTYHGAGIIFWTHTEKGEVSILLGKRSMNPQNRRWSFPGGGWDEQDGYTPGGMISYQRTAMRESIEEMGMKVSDPSALRLIWSLTLPFFRYKVYSYHLEGMVNPPYISEFSEYRWCTLDSLPKPLVAFVPSQIRALKLKT